MDKKMMVIIGAVLSTLNEVSDGKMIASTLYLALGMDYSQYTDVASRLSSKGLCKVTSTTITITDEGRKIAKLFDEAVKRSKE